LKQHVLFGAYDEEGGAEREDEEARILARKSRQAKIGWKSLSQN
jgi:hypothetical protein